MSIVAFPCRSAFELRLQALGRLGLSAKGEDGFPYELQSIHYRIFFLASKTYRILALVIRGS